MIGRHPVRRHSEEHDAHMLSKKKQQVCLTRALCTALPVDLAVPTHPRRMAQQQQVQQRRHGAGGSHQCAVPLADR
jgi:hypothetical protein